MNCDHHLSSCHSSLVYDKLRRLAAFHLRKELRGHALDPTDLVSEVYLRLAGAHLEFIDQAHFLAIASRKMRQILVDHARKRLASKRGSGERSVEFDETQIAIDRTQELVALGDALEDLVRLDERKARVTALHYFGGLTHDEIAMACGIHANTVSRELHVSEAWLRGRFGTGELRVPGRCGSVGARRQRSSTRSGETWRNR